MNGLITKNVDDYEGRIELFPLLDVGDDPSWMRVTRATIGMGRYADATPNPDLSRYYHESSSISGSISETSSTGSFCAAGANWALSQCGINGTDDNWALSFQHWGAALAGYRYGAIVTSMATSSSGRKRVSHISFFVRELDESIITLGYNQYSNSVHYTSIGKDNVSQIRWPTTLNVKSD